MNRFFGSFSSLLFFILIFVILIPIIIIQISINRITVENLQQNIDQRLSHYATTFIYSFKNECKNCESEVYFVKKYLYKGGVIKKEDIGSYFFSSEKPFSRVSLLDSNGLSIFSFLRNPDQTYFTPEPYEEFRDLPPVNLSSIKERVDTIPIPIELLPDRAGFIQRIIFILSRDLFLLTDVNLYKLIKNSIQKSNLPSNSFVLVFAAENNLLYNDPDIISAGEIEKIKDYNQTSDFRIRGKTYRIHRVEVDTLPFLCRNLKNISFFIGVDYTAMLSGIKAGLSRGLLLTTGFGVLVGILFLFTGLYIKNNTEKILNRTKEIASGEFEKRVAIQFPDEFRKIAENINDLSDRLRILTQEKIKSAKLSAIGRFAAHMVHDLRNPVYGLSLIASELKNLIKRDDPRYKYFSEIASGIERLGEIIERIADHSKIYEPRREKVEIDKLIAEVIQEFKKSNPCKIDFQPGNLGTLMLDPAQWRRVFLNLFQNSYEAKRESCEITIRVYPHQHPCPSVLIEISDNCGGISPEILEDIFEPFVTTKKKGLGLGLSFVKEIVEVHNGEIKIENKPGIGAKFTIIIPVNIKNENE